MSSSSSLESVPKDRREEKMESSPQPERPRNPNPGRGGGQSSSDDDDSAAAETPLIGGSSSGEKTSSVSLGSGTWTDKSDDTDDERMKKLDARMVGKSDQSKPNYVDRVRERIVSADKVVEDEGKYLTGKSNKSLPKPKVFPPGCKGGNHENCLPATGIVIMGSKKTPKDKGTSPDEKKKGKGPEGGNQKGDRSTSSAASGSKNQPKGMIEKKDAPSGTSHDDEMDDISEEELR